MYCDRDLALVHGPGVEAAAPVYVPWLARPCVYWFLPGIVNVTLVCVLAVVVTVGSGDLADPCVRTGNRGRERTGGLTASLVADACDLDWVSVRTGDHYGLRLCAYRDIMIVFARVRMRS